MNPFASPRPFSWGGSSSAPRNEKLAADLAALQEKVAAQEADLDRHQTIEEIERVLSTTCLDLPARDFLAMRASMLEKAASMSKEDRTTYLLVEKRARQLASEDPLRHGDAIQGSRGKPDVLTAAMQKIFT